MGATRTGDREAPRPKRGGPPKSAPRGPKGEPVGGIAVPEGTLQAPRGGARGAGLGGAGCGAWGAGVGRRARGMGCRAWAAGCGVPPALHLLTLLLPLDLRLLSSLAVHTLLRADLDELIETLPGAVGSGWGLGLAGGLRCMGHLGRNRPRSLGLGGLPHRVGLAQRKAELASDRTYPNTAPRLPTDRPVFLRVVLWQWVHRG